MCKPAPREPDYGELLGFTVQPDGSVVLSVSDDENYAHDVRLTHSEIAGIAEAAAEAYRTRTVACTRCHLDRPAFELNVFGICIVCVLGR
jgi:hypothetical protein